MLLCGETPAAVQAPCHACCLCPQMEQDEFANVDDNTWRRSTSTSQSSVWASHFTRLTAWVQVLVCRALFEVTKALAAGQQWAGC